MSGPTSKLSLLPQRRNGQPSGENAQIKDINGKFSSGKQMEGLRMLRDLSRDCSGETFTANCVKWLQQCCKIDYSSYEITQTSLNLFSEIIKRSPSHPELGRPIASSVTSRYFDVFSKKLTDCEWGWEALRTLMIAHNGSLAPHKIALETMMVQGFEPREELMEHRAKCFALLPAVGGGGMQGLAWKDNWRVQFGRLMQTTHHILDILFRDEFELQDYDVPTDPYKTFDDASNKDLVASLVNVAFVMEHMLLTQFPVAKQVPTGPLVDLIRRSLLSPAGAEQRTELGRTTELRASMPGVHRAMLRVLCALSVCVQRALLPLSRSIANLLALALQVSTTSKDISVVVYSALYNWMDVACGGSNVDTIANTVIPALLGDIRFAPSGVVLRGKNKNSNGAGPSRQRAIPHTDEVCFAALSTLSMLIRTVGSLLSRNQHQMVQLEVVGLASEIDRQPDTPVYCSSPRCRRALYSLLMQLCIDPSPQWPPPTPYALRLLSHGQNDEDVEVARECKNGISILAKIIHPEFSIAAFPNALLDSLQTNSGNIASHAVFESHTRLAIDCVENAQVNLDTITVFPRQGASGSKKPLMSHEPVNIETLENERDVSGDWSDSADEENNAADAEDEQLLLGQESVHQQDKENDVTQPEHERLLQVKDNVHQQDEENNLTQPASKQILLVQDNVHQKEYENAQKTLQRESIPFESDCDSNPAPSKKVTAKRRLHSGDVPSSSQPTVKRPFTMKLRGRGKVRPPCSQVPDHDTATTTSDASDSDDALEEDPIGQFDDTLQPGVLD